MCPAGETTPVQTPRRARAREAWDQTLQAPLRLEGAGQGHPGELVPRAAGRERRHLARADHRGDRQPRRRSAASFHPEDPSHLTPALRETPEYQGRHRAAAARDPGAAGQAAAVRAVHQHALPGPHAVGPGAAGDDRPVRGRAVQPEQRRGRSLAGHDAARDRGRQRSVPDAGLPGAGRGGRPTGALVPWGHITSGGTVANIEALWAARNLKFAGVALRAAIREVPMLAPARAARGAALGRRAGAAGRPRHLDAAEPRSRRAGRPAGGAGRARRSSRSWRPRRWPATRCRMSG